LKLDKYVSFFSKFSPLRSEKEGQQVRKPNPNRTPKKLRRRKSRELQQVFNYSKNVVFRQSPSQAKFLDNEAEARLTVKIAAECDSSRTISRSPKELSS
jgi:hypothetical protein